MANGMWNTNIESHSEPLTVEKVRAVFDYIKSAPMPAPCGSRENRHLVSPSNRDFCVNCGWMRPGSETERAFIEYLRSGDDSPRGSEDLR